MRLISLVILLVGCAEAKPPESGTSDAAVVNPADARVAVPRPDAMPRPDARPRPDAAPGAPDAAPSPDAGPLVGPCTSGNQCPSGTCEELFGLCECDFFDNNCPAGLECFLFIIPPGTYCDVPE